MSISYEDDTNRLGEDPNPEGFPCCPRCGEFVSLTGDLENYFCSECNYTFPLEEAALGNDYFPTEEELLEHKELYDFMGE